jgi:hypothetical protein
LTPFADPRRARSEDAAFRAERAWSDGQPDEAKRLFAEAAELEEQVARDVPISLPRVRSVLAISAVALWYKAGDFERAKRLAYAFLVDEGLTEQGRGDLEKLVDRCSREGEIEKLASDKGMVPLEVKLDGGRVGFGYAPAAAARKRREEVTKLLMRAAEIEAHLEYRERGESDLDRTDQIQIFEVPALAASYGLRFYVASGIQQLIAPERVVTPQAVVERFLNIATAAAEGPAAVRAAVPDEQYAQAFVNGFGEIAPDGTDVGTVACSAPSWKLASVPRTVFEQKHRIALRGAASSAVTPREQRDGERTVEGKLITVHLGSESWIEVEVAGREKAEVIMVDDSANQSRAVGLRDTDVRVFAKHNARRRRLVLNAIVPARSRG